MKPLQKAAVLSTLSFLLTAASCEKRVVEALPIPPERMDCVAAGARPSLPPEHVIDWSRVATVPQARAEHERFVATVRDREGRVAGYILDVEGKLFTCSSDAQWLREWQKGTAG